MDTDKSKTIAYYSKNAEALAKQYDSVSFESIHKDWLSEIPTQGIALDVGAGSGRDARFLAAQGWRVVAVEPADGIREVAQQYIIDNPIHWIADSLPELSKVFALQLKFDLIVLSAVWMHIAPSLRERSLRKLSSLLKPNGKLVISLRHGASGDERTMHPVSASELGKLAHQFGLSYQLLTANKQADQLDRLDVEWQTVLLTLPDDGTGAFPLIRNIVINDSKASTYKIALLRTLLRIAEGHPGAVLEQTDEHVVLPMGLVALYWMKLYKPLIDQRQMQQSSDPKKGLGFVQDKGWRSLSNHTNNDFFIGARYESNDIATALYQTLKDISKTIRDNPVKYTTLPGTKRAVFDAELSRTKPPVGALSLDSMFLSSLGKFYVPVHIWDLLTRYSVWIEPTLIHEWSSLMSGFSLNKSKQFSKLDYLAALQWENPERTTNRVRQRVNQLLQSDSVHCCWSGKRIKAANYAIDHAFPFARWPNNDLWNLLPANSLINASKSDKLVTPQKLDKARELITHWWHQGWQDNQDEFFTQANFALPNLTANNKNFDDVFDAFTLQRDRIKDFQQLADWC